LKKIKLVQCIAQPLIGSSLMRESIAKELLHQPVQLQDLLPFHGQELKEARLQRIKKEVKEGRVMQMKVDLEILQRTGLIIRHLEPKTYLAEHLKREANMQESK